MPKLDLEAIPQSNRTGYPAPYDQRCRRAAGSAGCARPRG